MPPTNPPPGATSKAYAAALAKAREASRLFAAAQKAFRARQIDDVQFLAARAAYQKSEAEFDAAFAAEARRGLRGLGLPAYHGSPHDFEQFSMQRIGSGEGNQSYGWGLYFASVKEVAEFYRRKLAGAGEPMRLVVDGEVVDFKTYGNRFDAAGQTALLEIYARAQIYRYDVAIDRVTRDLSKLIPRLREVAESGTPASAAVRDANDRLFFAEPSLKFLQQHRVEVKAPTNPGRLYRVEIPEADELLDYDKTLREQSPKVRAAVVAAIRSLRSARDLEPGWEDTDDALDLTGVRIYLYIGAGDAKLASERLLAVGVPGLKYLDQSSRGRGEGSHNFVIWDDRRIEVREKVAGFGGFGRAAQWMRTPGGRR